MAENIAKIDEKIRELKRKKKAVENREKITEIVEFLQEQESSGNWLSKWLAKQRAEK